MQLCGLICSYKSIFLCVCTYFLEVFFIKQELPINEQIRAKEVQVIDDKGEKKGLMKLNEALDFAYEKKLDLVLVAPNAQPPVCKIMNYGKYKFEQSKKARKFIEDGNKVKITVRFRGRELNYVKLGEANLNKFIEVLSDIASPEKKAVLEGKNMFIILAKKAEK